jgi:hypothetical protein
MDYNVKADLNKNRLYIHLEGFLSGDDVKKAADSVIQEAKKMKPGFSAINNIKDFKPTTPEGANEILRAQKFLKENGVGHVIRVVGEQAITSMQFKRTQNEAGYIADSVSTLEEADALLDKEEERMKNTYFKQTV